MTTELQQFSIEVDLAINIMSDLSSISFTEEELIQKLTSKGLSELTTYWVVIFLPTAMCRLMIPQVNWPETFRAYNEEGYETVRFDKSERYQIIKARLLSLLETQPGGDVVLRIAGRSAEFRAINKILLQENVKFEEIKFSELAVLYPLK